MAVAAVGAALLVAGCGSEDDSSSTASSGSSQTDTGGGGGSSATADAKAAVEKFAAPRTEADAKLPTESPKPVAGKKLAAVTCGVAVEGCRIISEAHVEAAKALGWDAQLIDGKGDAKGWNDAISQALASKPDVLALGAILPSAVSDVLQKAEDEGVTVICSVCGTKVGEAGVDVVTGDDFNPFIGESVANYIVDESGGKANVLLLVYPEFNVSKLRHDAAQKVFDACDGCKTETIEVKISEWGTTLPQRIQTILQQKPDINWIFSPGDATASDSINAIQAAGVGGKVQVGGGNGEKQSFQQVRDGTAYKAIGAVSYHLSSWQAVDNANRILAGEEPVETASPLRLITESNIGEIPEGEYYGADFDFRAAYKALWEGGE
jgi:ribose transport system substrate-binding protein